jgi:tetratricopeptide (TPR) repeat protein
VTPQVEGRPSPGLEYWRLGQAAMGRGHAAEAVDYYELSLAVEPALNANHLGLAAARLELNDEEGACRALRKYVACNPDDWTTRAQFGELLVRSRHYHEARSQFEYAEAAAPEPDKDSWRQSLHFQRRLMEIAEAEEDDYHEHLHRGIGLFYMARRRAGLPQPDGDLPVEGLLCKAAEELAAARKLHPDEARPNWYLYQVWSRLGRQQPALHALQEADKAAPFAFLTPSERRDLHLACQQRSTETTLK